MLEKKRPKRAILETLMMELPSGITARHYFVSESGFAASKERASLAQGIGTSEKPSKLVPEGLGWDQGTTK
ncbi:hypothetical protein MPNT_150028 [Candidatus Methylacidithermus pantelleriae]|uniref:Uncharacterized protein n=1 Tax=Candidatus Methylacidithermus pantelleriae TaxID=2744239 RepID=A0A8J2FN82_9BACT|nr:hypothetical protein MPNT_150028 [Candidatus Methylacidithermus pantelleriae]